MPGADEALAVRPGSCRAAPGGAAEDGWHGLHLPDAHEGLPAGAVATKGKRNAHVVKVGGWEEWGVSGWGEEI